MSRFIIVAVALCVLVVTVAVLLVGRPDEPESVSDPIKTTGINETLLSPDTSQDASNDPSTGSEDPETIPSTPATKPDVPRSASEPMPTTGLPVSTQVATIVDEAAKAHVRNAALKRLGQDLSSGEMDVLLSFLDRKNSKDNLSPARLNALKDSIANKLERQQQPPRNYANHLIAMHDNEMHDVVWRDYCVQHLGSWYPKMDADERQASQELFWRATDETKATIAGTALISLLRNVSDPAIEEEKLAAKALELAQSPSCGEASKLTAIQICAKLGEKRVLPTVRNCVTSGSSVPLKMSALAAIGTLGDESDRPLLTKYAASSDLRLRKSATSALARLSERMP